MYPDKQVQYSRGKKEGILMKRGKNDRRFKPRRFVISSQDNNLKYFKDNVCILFGVSFGKSDCFVVFFLFFFLHVNEPGEKMLNTVWSQRTLKPIPLDSSLMLCHVTIKLGLIHKAVQVCPTPITTTLYSPSYFRVILEWPLQFSM